MVAALPRPLPRNRPRPLPGVRPIDPTSDELSRVLESNCKTDSKKPKLSLAEPHEEARNAEMNEFHIRRNSTHDFKNEKRKQLIVMTRTAQCGARKST